MSKETDSAKHLISLIRSVAVSIAGGESGPGFKLVFDAVFGILKSSSVVLNDIANSLVEKSSLKSKNNRLYIALMKGLPDCQWSNFADRCISMMPKDWLWFAVDDSDVQKPYGKAFEAMSLVRDGSAKKKDTYGMGFMAASIVCSTARFKQPMCIFDRIHSSAEKDYLSANNVTNEGIRKVCAKLDPWSATFAFDRGYDDAKVMRLMGSLGQHYVIRMRKDRNIKVSGRKTKAFAEAGKRKGKVVIPMVYKGKEAYCRASHVNARIGGIKGNVTFVFSYLEGKDNPMILMTDRKISSKDDLIAICLAYHSRWKIEEHFRLKKVQYGFEGYRVKSLDSMNYLAFMLDAALLVLETVIERKETNSLFGDLLAKAKVIRKKVCLEFYRMATGAQAILMANRNGVKNYQSIRKPPDPQLHLLNIFDIKSQA